MAQPVVENHPQIEAIKRRLANGEQVTVVARAYDLKPDTLYSWWRRQRAERRTDAAVEIVGDLDDLDAELDRAEALIRKAKERGLTITGVSVEAGDTTWDGWTREHPHDPAVPAEQQATRRKATVRVAVPTEDTNEPVIRQAEPADVVFKASHRLPKRAETDSKWAVIMPDAQRPFVDHAAVDVALQILADVQGAHGVDSIIHLGDDLDLPDFGRHRSAPEALGLVQDAIDDQYRVLAIERAICPDARISWIEGNHEARLISWLVDTAPQLIGLRRAGQRTEPVLGIEYLCRLAELGVEYIGPHPEGEVYLNSHLRAVHGDIMKSAKGQTAAAYLAQGHISTVYGHIHRAELVYQTRHTVKGPRTYLAGSPGCLCRIDGIVPSAKSGINAEGKPGQRRTEDWQQGIWVVSYETTGRQLYTVEPVHIWGGTASWRGREYTARCAADGNSLGE